jgi:hypothetical protein
MLIVGPRRTLFAYLVGFGLKMVLGFAVAYAAPGAQMIDFFGFGYLLPTLLAVKMWNRESIGTVLMPTLQVSLVVFGVGNALGYTLAMVSNTNVPAAQAAAFCAVPAIPSLASSIARATPRSVASTARCARRT